MSENAAQPNELAKAAAVLNAAGRASALLDHVPADYIQQLAALHGMTGDVRAKVITILRKLGEENKASVAELTEEE